MLVTAASEAEFKLFRMLDGVHLKLSFVLHYQTHYNNGKMQTALQLKMITQKHFFSSILGTKNIKYFSLILE
jgi:hypothetical protein